MSEDDLSSSGSQSPSLTNTPAIKVKFLKMIGSRRPPLDHALEIILNRWRLHWTGAAIPSDRGIVRQAMICSQDTPSDETWFTEAIVFDVITKTWQHGKQGIGRKYNQMTDIQVIVHPVSNQMVRIGAYWASNPALFGLQADDLWSTVLDAYLTVFPAFIPTTVCFTPSDFERLLAMNATKTIDLLLKFLGDWKPSPRSLTR